MKIFSSANIFKLTVFFCMLTTLSVRAAQGVQTSDAKIEYDDIALVPAVLNPEPQGAEKLGTTPFQGISSISVDKNGTRAFAVWYGGGTDENPDNKVMLAYGDAKTLEFGDVVLTVKSPFIGKVRCFDPSLWRDPKGNIWLFWCQSAGDFINIDWLFQRDPKKRGHWDRRGGLWCSVCKNPSAQNPIWSKPRRLCDGLMLNKPEIAEDGSWLFPVSMFQTDNIIDLKSAREGAKLYVSRDEGKTLQLRNCVKIPDSPFSEHMFLQKRDGSLLMFARRSPELGLKQSVYKGVKKQLTYGNDGIFETCSTDGGFTFGKLAPSKIPHVGSRFCIRRLKSGNILLLKNYADDTPWLEGKPRNENNLKVYYREKIVAYLSDNDGATWRGGLILDSRKNVSYPDFEQDENGTIYATYDFDRYNSREICAAKFTEADVLAGRPVSEQCILSAMVNKGGVKTETLRRKIGER